jgi:hypothetical protein
MHGSEIHALSRKPHRLAGQVGLADEQCLQSRRNLRGWAFLHVERAAGSLRPHHCSIGLLVSEDGVHFRHVSDKPILTPEMVGFEYCSVQDPRVVKIEDTYYMTSSFRRFAWNIHPTGLGVPDVQQAQFAGFLPSEDKNQTRSGIAVSENRVH